VGERLYNQLLDFSAGINCKVGPSLIKDTELVDVENAILGKGFVQKRYGYERYSNLLSNPITKLYEYQKNSGDKEFLSVSNNQLFKDNLGTLQAISGSLTSNSVKLITYKDRSINDAVLLADGGKLKVYNGTNVSEVVPHVPTDGTSSTPLETTDPGLNDLHNLTNFRSFVLKKDRVIAAAHPTIKNRVSFCYFDPYLGYAVYDYFPADYFFDVAVEDNDEIVELRVFRSFVIIFCKRSIWALKGDGATLSDLELVKINVPNGCIAPNSICEVGNNLFYLADDHVYSLFATELEYVSGQIMSTNIQPILKSIGLADKSKAVSVFYDNKYYLSFPSGLVLVYDVTLESWTKFTNIQANSFLNRDGVLYFSSNTGLIYRFNENSYSDDGQPINFLMKTKICDFGDSIRQKKFRRLWVIQKQWDNYTSTYSLKALIDQYTLVDLNDLGVDFNTGNAAMWDGSDWDEAIWDFTEVTQNELKVRQKGKTIQIQISNNKVDEPLSIYGIVNEYKVKKRP
jgi:hypothetical protein